MNTNDNSESLEQEQLKASVAYIARNEAKITQKQVSPEFIQSLTDAVNNYIGVMANDLENFASNSDRNIIELQDVLLCARRNDSLYKIISDIANASSSNE